MKPPPLSYHRAESVEDAVRLLAEHGEEAKLLAGGQSLVPMLNLRLAAPEHLIDVSRIDPLRWIRREGDRIVVGAAVRQAEAEDDPELMSACPLLSAAFPHIAHREIRNAGTVGGSIAHGDCAAELPVATLALDAEMVLSGRAGERVVAAEDFFVSYLETAIEPGEVLTAIRLPVAEAGSGASFMELSRRSGDYAIAGVATTLTLREGRIERIAAALLGVAPTPVRAAAAERALRGEAPEPEAIAAAAEAAIAELEPPEDLHGDAGLRRRVAGTLLRRSIAEAAERAKGDLR